MSKLPSFRFYLIFQVFGFTKHAVEIFFELNPSFSVSFGVVRQFA